MNKKDYYQILGIDKEASQQQIKTAYRKLAFKYHPDRNMGDPIAAEKMKEINEAYATLSNPEKRREYDRFKDLYGSFAYERFRQSHSQQDIFRGSDINQIFDEFANIFGFRGADDIFREFYGSGPRSFEVKRPGFYSRGFVFTGSPRGGSTGEKNQINAYHDFTRLPFSGITGKLLKFVLEKTLGIQIPEKGRNWGDTISVTPQQAEEGTEMEYSYKK